MKSCSYLFSELLSSILDFDIFKEIITSLSQSQKFESEDLNIYIYLGDARAFIKETNIKFDVVYQHAFSPSSNPILWTSEYFADISKLMKEDAILTTYSIALPTRIALYENGFQVYLHKGAGFRSSTLASKSVLADYEKVDVDHKMKCNPDVSALKDATI